MNRLLVIYQSRFALLRLLQLPENVAVLIEKDDDLDFVDNHGIKSLASLKHKAVGDRLTDLSIDFWKSLRIWLSRYNRDGQSQSNLRFFIFTTSQVSDNSFLGSFVSTNNSDSAFDLDSVKEVLSKTTSKVITPIKEEFDLLNEEEMEDFLSRIVIFDQSPRIEDIPKIIIENHIDFFISFIVIRKCRIRRRICV